MGNDFRIVEIINDEISVSLGSGNSVPFIIITGEGEVADDLSSIFTGQNPLLNQELYLQNGNVSADITLKNLAGVGVDIVTPDGGDLVLGSGEIVYLMFNLAVGGFWVVNWISSGGSGGGSITEPIELGFNEVTTETPPTLTIVAGDIFNPSHIDLDQDIEIQLDISATTTKYKSIFVIFDTTGGGFTVTWPASVVNPPIISDSVAQRISVILYTINNGVLWTHATSVGSSSGGVTTLSDLIIDVNKDWGAFGISNFGALTGVTGIDLDGATALIQGPQKIDFFQTGQQIESLSTGIEYSVGDLQSHLFKSLTDEIAKFEESASGVFRLDMLEHTVDKAKDYRLDPNASYAIPGSQPGIGFDDINNRMRINVPTGNQVSFEENSAGFGTGVTINPASGGSVTANIINASDVLQLGVDVTVPTVVGEFRQDGTDVKVFSGGAVRNLSNITTTVAATTALDNLASVQINTDLLFDAATHNIGDSTNPVDNLFVGTVRLQNDLLVANAPSMTSVGGNSFDINFPTGSTFNIFENGVSKHTFSATTLTTPNVIINAGELFFNDGSAFPVSLGGIKRNGSALGVKFDTVSIRRDTVVAGDVPELDLVRVDAGPNANDVIGRLRFRIFDTPTETTYADIDTIVTDVLNASALRFGVMADSAVLNALVIEGNDNSQNFQVLLGGLKPRIQPSIGPMGYFVTSQVIDFSLNIGNSGTIEIPMIDDGSPSVTDLNQAFGAFVGAIGYDEDTAGTNQRIYVRNTDGTWEFFDSDGAIT